MARDDSASETSPNDLLVRARAWLLSLAAFLLLAIFVLLALRGLACTPAREVAGPAVAVAESSAAGQPEYFADEETTAHEQIHSVSGELPIDAGPTDQPPTIAGISLPKPPTYLPAGEASATAMPSTRSPGRVRIPGTAADEAAVLAEDALIPREHVPTGPTAQVSLFGGPAAVGRSFVFVIDRSASMGGEGLGAIQAAAKELSTRLEQLTPEQTFQVVAYNQSAAYLTKRELLPATSENKRELIQFIANLSAFGQTEHQRGLLSALRLKPEVIFLLTDGGDPMLNPGQLQTIREEASGRTAIHCLHFRRGPADESKGFMTRLATENRGSYTYIDMNGR